MIYPFQSQHLTAQRQLRTNSDRRLILRGEPSTIRCIQYCKRQALCRLYLAGHWQTLGGRVAFGTCAASSGPKCHMHVAGAARRELHRVCLLETLELRKRSTSGGSGSPTSLLARTEPFKFVIT